MKLSLSWLKELLAGLKNFSDNEIISSIEQLGYEIESVKYIGHNIDNVKTVQIVNIEKHPSADKLSLCDITDGTKTYKVVCGANNIYVGMLAAYIPAGSVLPNGTKIEVRKIRGVESQGMLCSEKELGLGEDHTGILELPKELPLGSSLGEIFKDTIIEISTPANRYDCLGHVGIAKELAIKLNLDFKIERIVTDTLKPVAFFDVKIESFTLCPRYFAININSVNNKIVLPYFITQRLKNCDFRSINPLVDISNYVLLEIGHPVHIFDLDKIKSEKIIVRRGKPTEKILALDGKEYHLDENIIVISDIEKPIAIAGIIGAENSAVSLDTKNIVIESAMFNRRMIRLARKKLNISTEASYRFERGCGWDLCELAALRTCMLVLKYCGGTVEKFSDFKDIEYYYSLTRHTNSGIKVDLKFISNLIGSSVSIEELFRILRGLGGEIVLKEVSKIDPNESSFLFIPPVNRQDIRFQADVAEEYLRFKGYEIVNDTLPTLSNKELTKNSFDKLKNTIVEKLVSYGFFQVMNYSLCSSEENSYVKNIEQKKIRVVNPISNEYSELRCSLLAGLLKNVSLNYNNQQENLLLFELGKVYYKEAENVREEEQIGLIIAGKHKFFAWKQDVLEYDFYFMSGVIENLLSFLDIKYKKVFPTEPINYSSIVKDCVCYYSLENTSLLLASLYEIDKSQFKKIPHKIFYGEIYIEKILPLFNEQKKFTELSVYPFVCRDLSLTVPDNIQYDEIINIIKNCSFNEIVDINIFDYYQKVISDKEKITTIGLNIKFQHKEKTLTDEEVNKIVALLLEKLKTYGIELRKA